MTDLWPYRNSRRLHRRHGTLFFLWLLISKGQFENFSRQNRNILSLLHLYKGFEKFFDPTYFYISSKRWHLTSLTTRGLYNSSDTEYIIRTENIRTYILKGTYFCFGLLALSPNNLTCQSEAVFTFTFYWREFMLTLTKLSSRSSSLG